MSRRRRVVVAATVLGLAALVVSGLHACSPPDTVVAVAAGDMACDLTDPAQTGFGDRGGRDECRAAEVSDVAVGIGPDVLLGLGDYQYEVPAADAYEKVYGPSWGRLRDVTVPAIGNQEYKVHDANTFRDYFGDRVGSASGFWSTDVGGWHVVVLNSNCTTVKGGCRDGSPQQRWLAQDLAESSARCTVALMHHPRWSNGIAGADQRADALVRTLSAHDVELLLSGHEANYERFAPLDGAGRRSSTGITQIVVGTGGQATYRPEEGNAAWRARNKAPHTEFFDGDHHGVLRLVLSREGWASEFVALGAPGAGPAGVLDRASGTCR